MALDPVALKTLALELAAAMPPTPDSAIDYPAVDVSERGKKMTAVIRIADWYNWHDAVTHFLQTKGVAHLSDLTDPQLEDLVSRMDGYVEAVMTGCDSQDALPVR